MSQNKVYSVSEITDYIRSGIESDPILRSVSVQGEISGFKIHTSGHIYFYLKDRNSLIKCVFFKGSQRGSVIDFKDGDKVSASGRIGIYPQRGEYQLYVRVMKRSGIGELFEQYERLREELRGRGFFSEEFKKPIPYYIQKIGVVTGKTAAGFQDMLKILSEDRFNIVLRDCRVQGIGAGRSIAGGIRELNLISDIDVIIIGRGGGSLEDLWGFNEREVAEAIRKSNIPVISAVGHETDILISDMVADMRAPTPTAAASMILESRRRLSDNIDRLRQRIAFYQRKIIDMNRERLARVTFSRLSYLIRRYIEAEKVNLREKKRDIRSGVSDELSSFRERLNICRNIVSKKERDILNLQLEIDNISQRLISSANYLLSKKKEQLNSMHSLLKAVNPENILKKGYSLALNEKDGTPLKKAADISQGEGFILRFIDDSI
ncbi:MAG: exodeoxyribonuclease VII large subunit, partial [Candidatus Muiribacteriaceae bacterium]